MPSTINTALSGLNAASTRLANAANNIANANSTRSLKDGEVVNEPYTPTRVQQTSLTEGGVKTEIVADSNPTASAYDPESALANEDGFVQYPNVNLEREVIETVTATYDYKANLNVIKAEKNLLDRLLDIFG